MNFMQKSDAAAELQKLMNVGNNIKYEEDDDDEEEDEEDSIIILNQSTSEPAKEKPICKPKVENGTMEEKKRQRETETETKAPRKKRQRKSESTQQQKKRKKRRWRPGTVSIREIKRYQKTGDPLIPYKVLERAIRRIAENYYFDVKLQSGCVDIIREILQDEIIKASECCQLARLNCSKQIMLTAQDLDLYKAIRFRNVI